MILISLTKQVHGPFICHSVCCIWQFVWLAEEVELDKNKDFKNMLVIFSDSLGPVNRIIDSWSRGKTINPFKIVAFLC